MNPLDTVTKYLSNLQLSTQAPQTPLQDHCQSALCTPELLFQNGCIDRDGVALKPAALTLFHADRDALFTFLYANRTADSTLFGILQTLTSLLQQYMPEQAVTVTGDELYKLLGTTFLNEATKAFSGMPTHFQTGATPPSCLTIRFHLGTACTPDLRHSFITDLHNRLFQPLFNNQLPHCFRRDDANNHFSGFTIDTIISGHIQKINFIFETQIAPYFATSDALQLKINTLTAQAALIDHNLGSQWLVDTLFKWLRIPEGHTPDNPTKMIIRHMRTGFFPLPRVYEAFANDATPLDVICKQIQADCPEKLLESLFILLHLLSKGKNRDVALPSLTLPFTSSVQAHLYLMQQTGLNFSQLQALITTVCLITGRQLVQTLHRLELVIDQIRLPIALDETAQIMSTIDPTLFQSEAFRLWLDYCGKTSPGTPIETALQTPKVTGPIECLIAMAFRQAGNYADIAHFVCSTIGQVPHALGTLYLQGLSRSCPELSELLGQDISAQNMPYILQQLFSYPKRTFHDLGVTLLVESNNQDLIEKWACALLKKRCDRPVLAKLISSMNAAQKSPVINSLVTVDPTACFELAKTMAPDDCDLILERVSHEPASSELPADYIDAMAEKTRPFHPLYLLRACSRHIDMCESPSWKSCVQAAYARISFDDIPQDLFSLLLHPALLASAPEMSAAFFIWLAEQQMTFTQDLKKCIRALLPALPASPQVTVSLLMLHQKVCKDTISDVQKELLVQACFQDLSNGSHLSPQCIHWYLSQQALELIVKKVDPLLQARLFLLLCRKAEQLIEGRHSAYVTALSRRLQARASLQEDLVATTQSCAELMQRIPTLLTPLLPPPAVEVAPAPKKQPPDILKTQLAQKNYPEVVRHLIQTSPSPAQVLTAINALIGATSPLVFTLFEHFELKDAALWERALKAFSEANKEGFCTGVCTVLRMNERLGEELQLLLLKFIFDNPSWTGDSRALTLLSDNKPLHMCMMLYKTEASQKLHAILNRLLPHLTKEKKYLSSALSWYGCLSPNLQAKPQLGWELFSMLDESSDQACVRMATAYIPGLLFHIGSLLAPPNNKASASRLASACKAFSTFFDLTLKYNCGSESVSLLVGFLQQFEIVAIHEMLWSCLAENSDAALLLCLESSLFSLIQLKGCSDPFVQKAVSRHMQMCSDAFLVKLFTFIFVFKDFTPSEMSAEKLVNLPTVIYPTAQFQQNLIFQELPKLYPRLLELGTTTPQFTAPVLDIDLSLHLRQNLEVQSMVTSLLPTHADLQLLLFCHQLERDGWSDATHYFWKHLIVSTFGPPKTKEPLENVGYEITRLPVTSMRHYQQALKSVHDTVLPGIAVSGPKVDLFTVIPRVLKTQDTLFTIEKTYLQMVSRLCRNIFTPKIKSKPAYIRVYMYDFALQLMRVCMERYPQHIDSELFKLFIFSIDPDDLLFSAHRKIALGILRQALHYQALTPETVKSKSLLEKIAATEEDLSLQCSVDALLLLNEEVEKLNQETHTLTCADILQLQNKLFDWQEFYFSDDFALRLMALSELFTLWKRLPTCIEDPSIATSFQALLFPNETFFGIHLPQGREHAIKVTELIFKSLVQMHINALAERPTGATQVGSIQIPNNLVHAFQILNLLFTYLLKAEYMNLFSDNYPFFASLMTPLITLISEKHGMHLEHLNRLADHMTSLCTAGPWLPPALNDRIELLNNWFKLLGKLKPGHDTLLSYALKPLIQSKIITRIPDKHCSLLLSWLDILYVKMTPVHKTQFKGDLAKQLARHTAFCPGGPLYKRLDNSLQQAIAATQNKSTAPRATQPRK